jgi:hypothetical protein
MSPAEFDAILQAAFRVRGRFSVLIEFTSGARLNLKSPEAVARLGSMYVVTDLEQDRHFFVAASVCRVLVEHMHDLEIDTLDLSD